MTLKRALILLSTFGFVFSASAAVTGAEAKMMMKKSHGKMMMHKPMMKKKAM